MEQQPKKRTLETPAHGRANWLDEQLCLCAVPWSREEYLEVMRVLQPRYIVRLLEDTETKSVYQYWHKEPTPSGVTLLAFPIKNGSIAEDKALEEFAVKLIRECREGVIWMHCVGAVGRSGTVAALYLAYKHNITAEEALNRVNEGFHTRKSKPGKNANKPTSPETPEQWDQVKRLVRGCDTKIEFNGNHFSCAHQKYHEVGNTAQQHDMRDSQGRGAFRVVLCNDGSSWMYIDTDGTLGKIGARYRADLRDGGMYVAYEVYFFPAPDVMLTCLPNTSPNNPRIAWKVVANQ